MAKYQSATWIEPAAARAGARWPCRALIALMVLAVAPLALDGLKVCYANWVAVTGGYAAIDTPAFDAVADARREVVRQTWQILGPIVRDPPWGAGTTIVLAAAWALMMAWMFRGRRL